MILSAQSVTKRYGAGPAYEAVRDASLELHTGEFVSIVGRSGSGKSTLLALLGALTKPTEGKVLLDGSDVWALSEAALATFRSRHIGFIFQFPSLLSNLTAVDNVAVPALLSGTMDVGQAYSRAYDLLARVGLAGRADAYPDSMSGGEQRRVVIARALINSPPLLLADEPTSDLDEDTETEIISLLEELQRSEAFGLVLVTHNLALAKHAQRTCEMSRGVLAPIDLPDVAGEEKPRSRHLTPAGVHVEVEFDGTGHGTQAHPAGSEPVARRPDFSLGRRRDFRRYPSGRFRGCEVPGNAGSRPRGTDRTIGRNGAVQPSGRGSVGFRPG